MRCVCRVLFGSPPGAGEPGFFFTKNPPAPPALLLYARRPPRGKGKKGARHWLDLVRYAESDGYKADSFRPNAWRYRDYVIRSFNEDKPYNRFLEEQIAADELWPEDPDALVGTGFLRLPIYEYNQRNVKGQWATILNDITDVTGDAFLGVGLHCARCPAHKFDPILQRVFYRMQAFFSPLWRRVVLPLAPPAPL